MYRIVICDDDGYVLGEMAKAIQKHLTSYGIAGEYITVENSVELPNLLTESQVDILFLDIDMPQINGMDIAKYVQENALPTLIIFVTEHDALVYDTFRYRPFGFIRKSHFSEEIVDTAHRLSQELAVLQNTLVFCKGQDIATEKISSVLYIEAEGNYIKVVKTDGISRYRETLTGVEAQSSAVLMRVHKGYLVNIRHIRRYKSNEILLCDGSLVPVGRSYEHEVRQRIIRLLRG